MGDTIDLSSGGCLTMVDDYTISLYLTRYFLKIANPISEEDHVLYARPDRATRGQALPDQAGCAGPKDGQIFAHTMHGG